MEKYKYEVNKRGDVKELSAFGKAIHTLNISIIYRCRTGVTCSPPKSVVAPRRHRYGIGTKSSSTRTKETQLFCQPINSFSTQSGFFVDPPVDPISSRFTQFRSAGQSTKFPSRKMEDANVALAIFSQIHVISTWIGITVWILTANLEETHQNSPQAFPMYHNGQTGDSKSWGKAQNDPALA